MCIISLKRIKGIFTEMKRIKKIFEFLFIFHQNVCVPVWRILTTVYPGILGPFYVVTYYMSSVKTSWTYSSRAPNPTWDPFFFSSKSDFQIEILDRLGSESVFFLLVGYMVLILDGNLILVRRI